MAGEIVAMWENGDRVRLAEPMRDDPCPIPVGATGTVRGAYAIADVGTQYWIDWDPPHEKRTLMPVCPPDVLEKINARGS
jgi:hypothetical protein